MDSGGPFGNAADIGIGFSDAALLLVSLLGFGMLASTMYSLLLLRLQTREEIEKTDAQLLDYDEQLDRADVATLNRAQRRARAKNIMKRQRRIAPAEHIQDDDNNVPMLQNDDETDVDATQTLHGSRKERQKAAKAAEREERKLFEEQRRTQQREAQEAAQRGKREKERQQLERIVAERQLEAQSKRDQESSEYIIWKTFLASPSGNEVMSVAQFVEYMKQRKTVQLDEFAERFHRTYGHVLNRIQDLVAARRLTGVVNDDGQFIYINPDEMEAMANLVRQQQELTVSDVANASQSVIQTATTCNEVE